ncbi:MAG: TIGR02757 family protein [Pseudomonadota bacterium]
MGQVRQAIRPGPEPVARLHHALEQLYATYDARFLDSDPLKFPHRYSRPQDREFAAFVAATFAFGNVAGIFRTLERILSRFGKRPVQKLLTDGAGSLKEWKDFKHRWITHSDLVVFLETLRGIYASHGSLEGFFYDGPKADRDHRSAIHSFLKRLSGMLRITNGGHLTRGLRFLVPAPNGGSALKRLNLSLRWVVRRKDPDLGLWRSVSPGDLYLPIDVHLSRILRYVGLTARKSADWKMAEEVTGRLKGMDPSDPVRFDFAISRLGILGRCLHRWDASICSSCPLEGLCLHATCSPNRRLDVVDAMS